MEVGIATGTSTRRPTPEAVNGERRSFLLWIPVVVVLAATAGIIGWLLGPEARPESLVPAETQERIVELIDDWHTAWNNNDGQAALDLFTVDGTFVDFSSGLGGLSGVDLKALVDSQGTVDRVRTSEPLISERADAYLVAVKFGAGESAAREHFELLNVVDENGTMKIQFDEMWSPLGWYRLTDDMPYRPSPSL